MLTTVKSMKKRTKLSVLGTSVFLAVSASLAFNSRASAIETVTLVFNESRTSVPFSDFRRFVETGETQLPTLQRFLGRIPNTSQALRTVMTREIAISRPFSERNFDNPIADFLLYQLSNALTPISVPDNLQPLRSALVASYRNNQTISIFEVMENYPIDELVVQLPRVERTYNRVSSLVQRIPAALQANEFLFNLVCNCPASTTQSMSDQVEAAKTALCP